MSKRLNISIPTDVWEAINSRRANDARTYMHLNLSAICTAALRAEVDRLRGNTK